MAMKPFNSVPGFSVGKGNATVILANGDVAARNLTVTNTTKLGIIANVNITGGSPGQLISTDGLGNLTFVNPTTSQVSNGSSNIQVLNSGNITFNSAGNANVVVITGAGANINGYATVTESLMSGNVYANLGTISALTLKGDGGNISNIQGANVGGQVSNSAIAGTVYTNAQPNITSVGTLTNLAVIGDATVGNLYANAGTIGASLLTGTLTANAQPNITTVGTLTSLVVTGNVTTGNVSGTTGAFTNVSGNGAALTAITGANVSGQVANALVAGTVTTNAQPNITSVGTLTSLGVTGNLSSGNANLGNTATANFFIGSGNNLSNIQGANVTGTVSSATTAITAGTVTTNAQPNITSVGILTSLDVNGNIVASNITANTGIFTGNGSGLSAIVGANVTGAVAFATTANAVAGANVSGAVAFATTANAVAGANVSGSVSSATTAGTVTTAAQPNITSVGTLTSATVTGNVVAGNLTTTGVLSVTGTGVSSIAGNLDMTSNNIINLASPVNSTDAATKQYVDDVAQGLHTHDSCNAATQTTLATISGGTVTYNNGTSGVGATLTTTGSYTTIDGVTLSNGMRILVKDEANTAHNGIYDRTSTTVLTRSDDFNTPAEMAGGDFTFVGAGTLYDNTGWVMPDAVATVGTSPVVWVQFSGAGTYTAGTGLTLTGSQFSVNVAQPTITSVGTLTGLAVNGNITAANITANTGVFTGNGAALTTLNASNISSGTLAQARLANSNVILGSTTLALGTTTTTIAGLSSVTSTTFVGALTGAATTAGTVTTAAQPNITSVGTLTSLGVSGAVTASTLTSNVATGTAPLTVTSTTRVANLNVDQAGVADLITVTAGTGNNFIVFTNAATGNVAEVTSTGLTANLSNNSITATTFVGTLSGAATSATTAGTVTTNAQPNITSVGTLTSLDVTGNISGGNLTTAGVMSATNGVVAGPNPIDTSAVVDVQSTTKGFLLPRMTTTQRDAISSPATGLQVYNTTTNTTDIFNGVNWSPAPLLVLTRPTTNYTLQMSDAGELVEQDVGTANTVTVPLNSTVPFPIGTKIDVAQYGLGQTTIVPVSGVIIRSFNGSLKIAGQYGACTLVKRGTNEWYCFGNLVA